MTRTLIALAASVALTGAAFAAGDTTTKSPGASGHAPGHEMKNDTTGSTGSTGTTAPMKGSPNASGAQMKNDASGSGSMGTGSSSTGTSTTGTGTAR